MTEDPALKMAVGWIATYEGFRSAPYRDQGGVWTIGYGATYLLDGSRVTASTPPVTQADAYAMLTVMVGKTLARVRAMVHVPISNHAAATLCSLCYNEGTGAIGGSTLMRLLNQGEPTAEVAKQFGAWVYDAGHVDPGLVQRRKNEADLFLTPDVPADPRRAALDTLVADAQAQGGYPAPVESEADRLDDQFNPTTEQAS
jgi:lysozyme